ncbi:MAG: hypothetical protein M3R38_18000 [Actinomycetota bacterium]|nr:hypothetical protein [Actinomycetota bacterium]
MIVGVIVGVIFVEVVGVIFAVIFVEVIPVEVVEGETVEGETVEVVGTVGVSSGAWSGSLGDYRYNLTHRRRRFPHTYAVCGPCFQNVPVICVRLFENPMVALTR